MNRCLLQNANVTDEEFWESRLEEYDNYGDLCKCHLTCLMYDASLNVKLIHVILKMLKEIK